jgi:hypothetical protein
VSDAETESSESADTTGRQRVHPAIWLVLLGLIAWGIAPFRIIWTHYPWKVDAVKWVSKGSIDNPAWTDWVFRSHHFVGYRPVSAFSFVVDSAIAGDAPWMHRLTDFTLHGLTAVAVTLLASRILRTTSAWVLLPALLYLGHPAVEEALPYLARRSYLLASLFGTLALVAWMDSLRDERVISPRTALATGLLALALLSNEAAYVLLPMLPLLAWSTRSDGLWKAIQRSVLPWAPAIPAVAARFAVLGWAGGYEKHYFAFTRGGNKTLRETSGFNLHEIVGAAYDYLWFPASFKGADTVSEAWPLVFLIAAFYTFALVVEPLAALRSPRGPGQLRDPRMPLLLFIWFFGYAMLFGLSRTWFWRQGFAMTIPFAFIVTWVAHDTVTRFWSDKRVLLLRLVPQAVLVVGVLWHSPLVRGMDPGPIIGRFHGNALVDCISKAVDAAGIEGPAHVLTVLPVNKGSNRNVHTWLSRRYGDRNIRFSTLAYGPPAKGMARVEDGVLKLGPQARVPPAALRAHNLQAKQAPVARLRSRRGDTWLVLPDPDTTSDGGPETGCSLQHIE